MVYKKLQKVLEKIKKAIYNEPVLDFSLYICTVVEKPHEKEHKPKEKWINIEGIH